LKTIGCRVSNDEYQRLKNKYGNINQFMKKAIQSYENKGINRINSVSKPISCTYSYDEVQIRVDDLISRYFKVFNKTE